MLQTAVSRERHEQAMCAERGRSLMRPARQAAMAQMEYWQVLQALSAPASVQLGSQGRSDAGRPLWAKR
jgi:hypothetical protein